MLSHGEALGLVEKYISKRNIRYHMLAVEAIMRSLARYFGDDEEMWGLVGLLHDIDYEFTADKPEKHTLIAADILKDKLSGDCIEAIKAHNFEHTGVKPETLMAKALIAADAISGLLVACALVMPSKKLNEVKVETVLKKFKAKDFAKSVSRERILYCEEIGLPLEKFVEITLDGLKSVAEEIGL
ncbi:MAG: HD domain-containing protein [Candidatus Bathyarchaeia archaeon]